MKFSVALAAALSLPVVVNAQYPAPSTTDSYPASESYPWSSGMPAGTSLPATRSTSDNINVQVAAGGQLMYSPSNFTAANGTTVTFFFTANISHSVTQGSFSSPCMPLAAVTGNSAGSLSGPQPAGFDSGLQPAGEAFVLTIENDQLPVWFFCKNSDHCGLGMVGSINAPATGNTYDAWLAAAKAIGGNEVPISDSGPVTGGVGAVATGTPFPSTVAPSSTGTGTGTSTGTGSGASPTYSGSASHIVANGFVALLVAAFAIRLA